MGDVDKSSIRIEPARKGTSENPVDVFHVGLNVFRHPEWPEFSFDMSGMVRLSPRVQVRWLTEADGSDPLNQLRRLIVSFGESLTWRITFADIAEATCSVPQMVMQTLICALLDPARHEEVVLAVGEPRYKEIDHEKVE